MNLQLVFFCKNLNLLSSECCASAVVVGRLLKWTWFCEGRTTLVSAVMLQRVEAEEMRGGSAGLFQARSERKEEQGGNKTNKNNKLPQQKGKSLFDVWLDSESVSQLRSFFCPVSVLLLCCIRKSGLSVHKAATRAFKDGKHLKVSWFQAISWSHFVNFLSFWWRLQCWRGAGGGGAGGHGTVDAVVIERPRQRAIVMRSSFMGLGQKVRKATFSITCKIVKFLQFSLIFDGKSLFCFRLSSGLSALQSLKILFWIFPSF